MSRKVAQFQVSAQLIKEALAMPKKTKIHNIVRHDYNSNVFVFFVEHPDFDEIEDGEVPPELTPIIEADYEKRPSTWLTFNWDNSPVKLNLDTTASEQPPTSTSTGDIVKPING